MSPLTNFLIGTFVALGTVSALPQGQQYQASSATPSATPNPAPVAPAPNNDDLIAKLLTKSTAVKKFQLLLTDGGDKLLPQDQIQKQTVFDFNNAQPNAGAKGGATKSANIDTFPILTELGISTTLGFLDACGINTPHVHPRAAEFLTVVDGEIDFGMILENGLVKAGNPSEVAGNLKKFQGTVFPMGAIHYQINPKCEPATFVATLNSEDPGTSQIAQNFFGLNADVVNATLGFPQSLNGKDIESFRKDIPANIAQAIDTCLKSCK